MSSDRDIAVGKVTASQVMKIVNKQEFRCAISGRPLTPKTASLDHIVPLASGGAHCVANVWIVDHQVNTAKGTLTIDAFIDLCRDVVEHQYGVNIAKRGESFAVEAVGSSAGPRKILRY